VLALDARRPPVLGNPAIQDIRPSDRRLCVPAFRQVCRDQEPDGWQYARGGRRFNFGRCCTAKTVRQFRRHAVRSARVNRRVYAMREEAKADMLDNVERLYDPRRRYSTPGYLCPVEYENAVGLP